jgi:hypothetical protein
VTVWLPAVPAGIKAIYAVLPVVMAVHEVAFMVSSTVKVKNAPAISTLLPAAIADRAEESKLVSDTA